MTLYWNKGHKKPPESLDNEYLASDWDLGLYSESDEENCETDVVATLEHELSSDELSIIEKNK